MIINNYKKLAEYYKYAESTINKSLSYSSDILENRKNNQKIESIINMETPLDFSNIYNSDKSISDVNCDSISDGLILSLNNLGKVDIEYISKISGYSLKEVINGLKSSIVQDPLKFEECFFKGYVLIEDYLSGNLKYKYKIATEYNKKYNGLFDENIKLLEKAVKSKPSILADDIYFTLGSPWIPRGYIQEFIKIKFGYLSVSIAHDDKTGSWSINTSGSSYNSTTKYGTLRMPGINIITNILNQTEIVVCDSYNDSNDKKKYVKNEKETILAREKEKLIITEFKEWILSDPRRKEKITEIYNDKFAQIFQRKFNGSFLTFKDLSKDVKLYDYQKNAIARIIFSNNTLLAHDVGSGKTYEMICAAHEMKRMGLSNKNLIVVPKGIINQWEEMYKECYKDANILVIKPKDFTPAKRNDVLNDIIYNDYEAIIMTYGSFDLIPMSPDYYIEKYNISVKELEDSASSTETYTKTVKTKLNKIRKGEYQKTIDSFGVKDPNVIYFDDLKIERLFVDEAHNYKNVTVETKSAVRGVINSGSKKSELMMDKVHYTQKINDGKGVIFATGTPITNSIADCFNIMRYLLEPELKLLKIDNFDSWISNYAEKESVFEIDVDTNGYRVASRYTKFHNLKELSDLLSLVADFHHIDKNKDIPLFNGYNDILIKESKPFKDFLDDISIRADLIRKGTPREANDIKDNMLLLTTDGRKAALDLRLFYPDLEIYKETKCYACSKEVYRIYKETDDFKGTQLIFSDIATPKESFNVYDEIKRMLVNMGIKEKEIAFIHSASTEKEVNDLLEKVDEGKVRVLIGSTQKLGTGVNVQRKLYAIHHLDIPWRPSDLVQREGRILRPGNLNNKIEIYRYITEHSFDAYSYQILEMKQNFISKLLNNDLTIRDAEDVDDTVLNYAEVKALAIGNPLIKERVILQNEISRLKTLENKLNDRRRSLEIELENAKTRLPILKSNLDLTIIDRDYALTLDLDNISKFDRKEIKETIYQTLNSSINTKDDTLIMNYNGFDLYAPAHQLPDSENIFILLKRTNTYHLKISNTLNGILVRINNFISNFEKYTKNLSDEYNSLKVFIKNAELDLKNRETYIPEIKTKEEELLEIDAKLGLNEKKNS